MLSERRLLALYPGEEGFNFFLMQTPAGREADVKAILELALADRGFEVTPTAERLEAYLAVENTYLSTFQALGGLGLVLGSLGLAVVLLRGVWERRGELALLRALGWRRRTLGWLVLAENGFLLLLGLARARCRRCWPWPRTLPRPARPPGSACSACSRAWWWWAWWPVSWPCASTLRAPLVPALRRE